VFIPERQVDYYSWSGSGWLEIDPTTGSTGAMIAGVMSENLAGSDDSTKTSSSPGKTPRPGSDELTGVLVGGTGMAMSSELAVGAGGAAGGASLAEAIALLGSILSGVAEAALVVGIVVVACAAVVLSAVAAHYATQMAACVGVALADGAVAIPLPFPLGGANLYPNRKAEILALHGIAVGSIYGITQNMERAYVDLLWMAVAPNIPVLDKNNYILACRPGAEIPFKSDPEATGPFSGWFIVVIHASKIVSCFALESEYSDPDVYVAKAEANKKAMYLRVFPLPPLATWTLR
jgi:hypothetical protein